MGRAPASNDGGRVLGNQQAVRKQIRDEACGGEVTVCGLGAHRDKFAFCDLTNLLDLPLR